MDRLPRINSTDGFLPHVPSFGSFSAFGSFSNLGVLTTKDKAGTTSSTTGHSSIEDILSLVAASGDGPADKKRKAASTSYASLADHDLHVDKKPSYHRIDDADDDVDVQCSFRYEFQPASVDTRVPGLVRTDSAAKSMVVEVAHANAPGGIEFKGKVTENKDVECVLIFDSATQTFTLEKLPLSCAQLRVLSLLWLHVFAPPPPTTEMQLRAFEAWIRQHGGRIGNVQLAAFPGMGIGVQTTSDITEKDEVLYLPRDLVICRDTVTKQLPREFLRMGPHADDDLLATFLLLERLKGPASKWAPYLALIGDAKRSTTAAFKALLRKLSAVLKKRKASLSLDDYIWATSVLGSRALTIQGVRYLVPFADMFNGQSHPVYCAYPLFTLDIVGWAILQALVLTDGDAQTCATTHTCLEFESPGKVMTHADAAAWVLAAATAALQVLSVGLVITFRRQRKLILHQLVVTLTAATASSRPASEANVVADAAAVSPEPANSVDDKIHRFHQWFNNLTTTNKLHVRYMGPAMGYGTFATEDIAADDVYVGVPTASILDTASATRHPHLAAVFRTLAKQVAALKAVDLHEAVVAYQLQ
ncbi:hypothetical protein DYB28_006573, partial [Aphanomyces astaci]